MSEHDPMSDVGRRELLKAIGASAGYVALRAALPLAWSAPVVLSMPLPAHAATSCEYNDPTPSGTLDSTPAIRVARSGSELTLTVTPPQKLRDARTPYQIVERGTCTRSVSSVDPYGVKVIATVVPTNGAETFTQSLARPVDSTARYNKYAYQLRWEGGYTNWVDAP